MIINSKDYFNIKIKWNKSYEIKVIKTKNDLNEMIEYFKKYMASNDELKYVGLDFEFNSSPEGKKIALFQINLESKSNIGKIYLFYPPDLSDNQKKVLIDLLIDNNIKKILHGAESLDIPYLFKNIFINEDLKIKFCNNLFDTRYLCEYYHIENNIDNKCKIYRILREMNVIDDIQLEMLLKNEEDMGPIYLIEIDVRNLNEFTMLYSAFDVLYLPALLQQFPNNYTYNKLIPEITCFNYIDRYENLFTKPFSILVGKINNYFLKLDEDNNNNSFIKLIDIYQLYYHWIDDENQILNKLKEINYFKKFIEIFIKFSVYKNILRYYEIWESKETLSNEYKDLIIEEKKFQKFKIPKEFDIFFSKIYSKIKKDIYNQTKL